MNQQRQRRYRVARERKRQREVDAPLPQTYWRLTSVTCARRDMASYSAPAATPFPAARPTLLWSSRWQRRQLQKRGQRMMRSKKRLKETRVGLWLWRHLRELDPSLQMIRPLTPTALHPARAIHPEGWLVGLLVGWLSGRLADRPAS